MTNILLTIAPCSPEAAGLDPRTPEGIAFQNKIDKRRTRLQESTTEGFLDDYCSRCPNEFAAFCESQGFYTDPEGGTKIAEGIFGGYTEAERMVRGPRKFDLEA